VQAAPADDEQLYNLLHRFASRFASQSE
jgi:hypothetical protein